MKNKLFNTGETSNDLRKQYNPEGSIRRKVQLRLLDMLLYFDAVCKECGVPYLLDGGNVLGAIRHGGFIPWDDDVDVLVEKKYYNQLCLYIKEHPHPQYVLQSIETDPGNLKFWNTLRDKKSKYVHRKRVPLNDKFKYQGLQIDIFCFELGLSPLLNRLSGAYYRHLVLPFVGKCFPVAKFSFYLQKNIIHPLFNAISKFIGNKEYYMYSYGPGFPYKYHKDILFPSKLISFEGHMFPCPAQPEMFCSVVYGNYQVLPPKDKRNHHDVEYDFFD